MFKCNILNVLLDSVIGNMTMQFEVAKAIHSLFSVLWQCNELEDEEIAEN